MKLWLALALVLTPIQSAEPTPKLAYSFRVQNSTLHVEITLNRVGREIDLVLPTSWGDAVDLHRGVANLHALEGQLSRSDDPGTAKVRTVNGRARIAYDLIQDWSGVLRESVSHRPHLDASHLEINTANALVHPRLDPAQKVNCTFEWRLPTGWALATTFGTTVSTGNGIRQRFRGPWNDVANAMFAAGDFRVVQSKIDGGILVTAIRGKFGFSDSEATEKIVKLIRLEREFWHDKKFPYFVVTLAPYGAGQSGTGGSGFTNAFNLYNASEGPISIGMLSLLAHEIFHTWNPLKMGRIHSPQENTNWFTEGFTTYYQDLLLWRAGLIDEARYLHAVNGFIRDYHFSSARNASLQELITRTPQDRARSRIPYERGAMIALRLDEEIRRRSNGKSTLDTLMRELFEERAHHAELSQERILAAIGRHVDPGIVDEVRQQITAGNTVKAPQKIRVPCAERTVAGMPVFELGMDRSALIENRRVTALRPGSAAERAGAREGDAVTGIGVYWNDVTRPVLIKMQSGKTVEYLPHGPTIQVPQYRCP